MSDGNPVRNLVFPHVGDRYPAEVTAKQFFVLNFLVGDSGVEVWSRSGNLALDVHSITFAKKCERSSEIVQASWRCLKERFWELSEAQARFSPPKSDPHPHPPKICQMLKCCRLSCENTCKKGPTNGENQSLVNCEADFATFERFMSRFSSVSPALVDPPKLQNASTSCGPSTN